ncbi:PREDICTED: huntingtin-interacting protein K [Nicrophorus vespilloides]|uniref:Huntingtin-interacting protein K n=1 Tax=Nicrophorus vespilloides TaxID=110193 RepID=A0ABM1MPR0_NICVS|nr:PREDICTED: huntingtin-interacting protein K [Nicrophorus vespilloides]
MVTCTMADEACKMNGADEEVPAEKAQKKSAKYDSGVADLEKVTDYAEEKELSTQDFAGAISAIGDQRNKEALEKQAREKELLKVSIKKEDVDLIVKEMEISRSQAERTLREHHGNVVNALITLTN